MDLVTGAVGSLISKLGELLYEEYRLQNGMAKKIGSLIEELECAQAALHTVAEVPPDQLKEQERIWARHVREASYDMEDVLDKFLVSAHGDSADQTDHQSFFESLHKKIAGAYNMVLSVPLKRRKITVTIDDINKRLKEVTERHRRYKGNSFVSKPSPALSVDPRLVAMYKEVTQLVGIEKPSMELMSMLSLSQGDNKASNKKMKIVSVLGTGGLGKTTLAKVVYEKVKVDFQRRAFVSVGREPDLKKVFRDILIELNRKKYMKSKYKMLDERNLIDEIREYLGSKRYFLIIDDIWDIKSWEMMKLALIQDNYGIGRVVTTTRNLEVAKKCGEVYKLKPLPFDESKKLLYTRIFGPKGKCPDTQLDETSDKILKKCDGGPLAIITMASLLVGKSREEWFEMCHSIIFRDKKENQQVSDTEWILSLSYYDLPAHLKTCLLYLSAFPEDYIIDKDPLIRKWVAEGFVHSKKPGTRLFEVGEGYFNELINRSMIQMVESEGNVYGCRLHDMVLDLLRVRSQEENFITISRNTCVAEGTSSPSSKLRRLVHQNKTEEQTHQVSLLEMDFQHVRTFIAYLCDTIIVDKVQSFQLLRVLALEGCRDVSLEYVDKLLHLRYLGIIETETSKLPEGIGSMKFLQTLDMEGCNSQNLPSSLGLLTQLICLRAGIQIVPNGVINRLTSLEELKIYCRKEMVGSFVKELGFLRELRVLECELSGVLDKSLQSDLVESLGNLQKIQYLTLRASSMATLETAIWNAVAFSRRLRHLIFVNMEFTALPSCINPSDLPNLTCLKLHVDDLDEQGLKILGALPELLHLKLHTRSTITITVNDASHGFFPKLRFCSLISSVPMFVLNEDSSVSFTIWSNAYSELTFGSRNATVRAPTIMPNLEVLKFYVNTEALICYNGSCDKLGLEYLPLLQEVKVEFTGHHDFIDAEEKEMDALRRAIEAHPNQPTLEMYS